MIFEFLQPVDSSIIDFCRQLSAQHLGQKVTFHTRSETPILDGVKIAIVGILDNRGSGSEESSDLHHVRMELYKLFPGNWALNMVDLGDILAGDTTSDTNYAVKEVFQQLLKRGITPIVIGGSQDLTYSLYRSYDNLEQMVNLVTVDSKFDFGNEEEDLTSTSYLSKIIIDEPNNLFNYSNIGYQTYFNAQEEIDLIEKLYFEAYRLGELSTNITLAEPIFRDADLVSIDLNCVQSAVSGNDKPFMPNGFNGKEICTLARYAGISDKVSMFGLFNQGSSYKESLLIAEVIWYFIEGFHYRSKEYPFGTRSNYTKYTVPLEVDELIFFKSNVTDRWWIEIPNDVNVNNKLKINTLLPCSYEEYLDACNQELPERWLKAQRKNFGI
ncbi:MAG: formimidoylglutamase [Flavobacterium sp.]